jgi:hypothetical protein
MSVNAARLDRIDDKDIPEGLTTQSVKLNAKCNELFTEATDEITKIIRHEPSDARSRETLEELASTRLDAYGSRLKYLHCRPA